MALRSSPQDRDQALPQKLPSPSALRLKRRLLFLLAFLLLVGAVIVWQGWYQQHTGMIVGRPLASPETHLHEVVISSRPGVVYLGTHFGLFTSTDGGHTWPQQQGSLNIDMITSIAVSMSNPDLLAVVAIPTGGFGQRAGIYVSADAGEHWRFTLPAGLPPTAYPSSIQSGVGVHGRFYAFFRFAGWFETQDLGQHWYAVTPGPLATMQTPSWLPDPGNPDHALLGGDQGLFETWNDGRSWQRISAVSGAVVSLAATTPLTRAPRTIFCATDQGLYRWEEGRAQATPGNVLQVNSLPASSPPTRLVLDPDGSALFALFGSDLWFSDDLGATWTHRWHFARGDLVALVLDPAHPGSLLAGFFWPGLVLISTNAGMSWQTLTN